MGGIKGTTTAIEIRGAHIVDRTSYNAAPSHKSAIVVTGLVSSKVAKKEKNALSSLRCASDMAAHQMLVDSGQNYATTRSWSREAKQTRPRYTVLVAVKWYAQIRLIPNASPSHGERIARKTERYTHGSIICVSMIKTALIRFVKSSDMYVTKRDTV